MTGHAAEDRRVAVLANDSADGRHYRLRLEARGALAAFEPGQFAMLDCGGGLTLRRPLSLQARIEVDGVPAVELMHRVVGAGTGRLAALRAGDTIEALGPLGRPFSLPSPDETAVLLGGGIGIPPIAALAAAIAAAGLEPPLLVGGVAGTGDDACLDGLRALGLPLLVATMDGSQGVRGTVLDALDHAWCGGAPPPRARFYACGPVPMLAAVGARAQRLGCPCELSVEARMGCGFGACVGCAVPRSAAARAAGASRWALACREGPVFAAAELDLDALEGP